MHTFLCSAILFDLDGVLVDSTGAVAGWWRLWAGEHNIDPDQVVKVMHGRPTMEVVQLMAPHLDAEAETKKIEDRASGNDGVFVMPGAVELLKSLPPERWAVVTSGNRRSATARLQFAGLPVPRVLVGADDVSKGKPAPEPYLKGAEGLGMNPTECLVIEDAPAGIHSAHAGGMKVIALTTTFPAELLAADAVAGALREIRVSLLEGKLQVEV
jgi:mannitol-1-/sugar-/sorbitol-6-phosphatase